MRLHLDDSLFDPFEEMPIAVARWLIRSELERIERNGGSHARDLELAIEALMRDAIQRDREAHRQ